MVNCSINAGAIKKKRVDKACKMPILKNFNIAFFDLTEWAFALSYPPIFFTMPVLV